MSENTQKTNKVVSRKVEEDSKKKAYPKVVRDSYSDGSIKGDLKYGAKAKNHSGRILAGVAKDMKYQRDIKDYNIQQLKLKDVFLDLS